MLVLLSFFVDAQGYFALEGQCQACTIYNTIVLVGEECSLTIFALYWRLALPHPALRWLLSWLPLSLLLLCSIRSLASTAGVAC